jgi:ParB family chromosome partitioning protein
MAFQGDSIYWVEVEKVVPNPFQPRREFDQGKLQELADSIRMYGVLQPLTVTRSEIQRDDGTFYTEYELIAGERRLRASKLAGVAQVPVIIREGEQNEQEKLELAIIENLQREDLNSVDRAVAFKQLAETFGLSHSQVAKKVGRSREYVSNTIRLLGLPEHMLESIKTGDLMEGHARTLLMISDKPDEQEVVFREIILKKMSVREVERIVRRLATDKIRKKENNDFDANIIELEKQFTESLGTRVQIQKTDFGGKLTIDYFSEDDLTDILRKVREERNEELNEGISDARKISENTPLDITESEYNQPSPEVAETPPVNNLEPESPKSEPISGPETVQPVANNQSEPERIEDRPVESEVDHDITDPFEHDLHDDLIEPESNNKIEDPRASYFNQGEDITADSQPATDDNVSAETSNLEESDQTANEGLADQPAELEPKEKPKPKSDDDSNLYSISNFSI